MALKTIEDYQKDWQAANARGDKDAMEAAHAGAEAIRAQTGQYSGGADGSQYIPLSQGSGSGNGTSVTPAYTATGLGSDHWAGVNNVNQADQDMLKKHQQDWQAATARGDTDAAKIAHDAAQAIRAKYGYDGGDDGSEGWALTQSGGSRNYGTAPSYTEKYQGQIDSLMQQLLNRDKFSYNYLEDPLYQQYRDAYTREGARAMQDTLGQSAARTGGYLSTAGEVAAQQANNYYMAQLGDKVPELQQLAYKMYLDDLDMDVQNLGLLNGLESFNYDKYLTQLGQYNTDRNFNYGVYRDEVGDARYNSETEYERAAARAQLLAAAGDYSGYKALGYSDSDIATMQAAGQLGSISTSGGRVSGNTGGGTDWSSVEEWVSRYGEDTAEDYIGEHYKEMGYSSKSTALSAWKNHQLERAGQETNYNTAMEKAKEMLYLSGGASQAADFLEQALDAGNLTESEVEKIMNALKI